MNTTMMQHLNIACLLFCVVAMPAHAANASDQIRTFNQSLRYRLGELWPVCYALEKILKIEESYIAGLRLLATELNKKVEKGSSHDTVLKYWHEQKDEIAVYIQEREKRRIHLKSRKDATSKEIDDITWCLSQSTISMGGFWGAC